MRAGPAAVNSAAWTANSFPSAFVAHVDPGLYPFGRTSALTVVAALDPAGRPPVRPPGSAADAAQVKSSSAVGIVPAVRPGAAW